MLGKVDVNGNKAEPLFEWIKAEKPGLFGMKRVLWNFEKALINSKGEVVGRWRSMTKPESLEQTIIQEIENAKKNGGSAAATTAAPTATESAAPAQAEAEAKLA